MAYGPAGVATGVAVAGVVAVISWRVLRRQDLVAGCAPSTSGVPCCPPTQSTESCVSPAETARKHACCESQAVENEEVMPARMRARLSEKRKEKKERKKQKKREQQQQQPQPLSASEEDDEEEEDDDESALLRLAAARVAPRSPKKKTNC